MCNFTGPTEYTMRVAVLFRIREKRGHKITIKVVTWIISDTSRIQTYTKINIPSPVESIPSFFTRVRNFSILNQNSLIVV